VDVQQTPLDVAVIHFFEVGIRVPKKQGSGWSALRFQVNRYSHFAGNFAHVVWVVMVPM